MARKRKSPQPTNAELAILRVLWERGPSTVREVQEALSVERDYGYTTVLKLLQIMHEKGLVDRDESRRSHVYSPTRAEEETQRDLIDDLASRAFGGSASKLVMRALSSEKATPEELEAIRKLLDDMEDTSP